MGTPVGRGALALIPVLLLTGCTGPDTFETGQFGLLLTISMVLLSSLVYGLLARFSDRRFGGGRHFLLQSAAWGGVSAIVFIGGAFLGGGVQGQNPWAALVLPFLGIGLILLIGWPYVGISFLAGFLWRLLFSDSPLKRWGFTVTIATWILICGIFMAVGWEEHFRFQR